MTRRSLVAGLTLGTAQAAFAQRNQPPMTKLPMAKDAGEQRILDTLDAMMRQHETYLSVPPQDGRWLRVLAETTGAKHIAEIGTSTGYSGLWFALALRRTAGRLTTFEIDPGRAKAARERFRQAGVDSIITLVEGDAHTNVTSLKAPLDAICIDAEKSGYMDYWKKTVPLVKPGGLVLAHNIGMTPDYVAAVTSDPNFDTVFYMEGNDLAVTLKKV
jgi:predicted O-methyltransferase YrrM